jgi:heme-degrading monooxygenase HmoA
MYARVTTLQGDPSALEEGLRTVRDQVIPGASQIVGFRGMLALADRTTGRTVSITLWDDQDAMQRSEEFANQLRSASAATSGATIVGVDRFEVVVNEMVSQQPT